MANPCKYTIKGIDTPLDYDQVRAYMLENYSKLKGNGVADSKSFETPIVQQLKENHPNTSFYFNETDNNIELISLFVNESERSKGQGSAFLSDLKKYSDKTGKPIIVKATSEFGGDVKRLNKFYPDNGFQKVGENKFEYNPKTKTNEKSTGRSEQTRDGGGRDTSREIAPLEGAPDFKGARGPDPQLVAVAEKYAKENGIKLARQAEYAKIDEGRAVRLANEYQNMKNEPNNPVVREAYANLIRQTKAQYKALVDAGYKFSFFGDKNDPYDGNPVNAMRDLRQNKKMAVYSTTEAYGTTGITEDDLLNNPMLEDTGIKWKDQDGVERPVLANDLFRAVHDAFGHGLEGAGFRARGEENAWQAHVRLFTGSAIGAITSETRGQNSWLNYGPYTEINKNAKIGDTIFAEQKTGLMPEWTWTEGRVGDMPTTEETSKTKTNAVQEQGAGRQIPSAREAGQNIPEGGQGVRPSEQGKETAKEGEEEVKAGSVVGGEVEEKVSGLQHTKSQLEEIAKEEGIDNAIASFKKDLSVKENRLAELTKYEKGKLPSQKTKTKEIQSLEKRIEEVRKDVENLEKIKSEQSLTQQTTTQNEKAEERPLLEGLQATRDEGKGGQAGAELRTESQAQGEEEVTATSSFEDIAAQLAEEGKKVTDLNAQAEAVKQRFKETLAKRKALGSKSGIIADNGREKGYLDRMLLNDAIEMAKIYVQLGIKNVQSFAKEIGEKVDQILTDAWNVANGAPIPDTYMSDKEMAAYELGKGAFTGETGISMTAKKLAEGLKIQGKEKQSEQVLKEGIYNKVGQKLSANSARDILNLLGYDDAVTLVGQGYFQQNVETEIYKQGYTDSVNKTGEFSKQSRRRFEAKRRYLEGLAKGLSQAGYLDTLTETEVLGRYVDNDFTVPNEKAMGNDASNPTTDMSKIAQVGQGTGEARTEAATVATNAMTGGGTITDETELAETLSKAIKGTSKQNIADRIRKGKFGNRPQNNSLTLVKAAVDESLEQIATDVENDVDLKVAIGTGINKLKQHPQFTKLTPKQQEKVEKDFRKYLGEDILKGKPTKEGKSIFDAISTVVQGGFTKLSNLSNPKVKSALDVLLSFGAKLDANSKSALAQLMANVANEGVLAVESTKESVRAQVLNNLKDINGRLKQPMSAAELERAADAFVTVYESVAGKKIEGLIKSAYKESKVSISGSKNPQVAKEILYGALDDVTLRDKFAAKYGLPVITPAVQAKLTQLATNIAKAPSGAQKITAKNAMKAYITTLQNNASNNPFVRFKQKTNWLGSMVFNNVLFTANGLDKAFVGNILGTARTAVLSPRATFNAFFNKNSNGNNEIEFEFEGEKRKVKFSYTDAAYSALRGNSKLTDLQREGIAGYEQRIRDQESKLKRRLLRTFTTSASRTYALVDSLVTPIASAINERQVWEQVIKDAYKNNGLPAPSRQQLTNDVNSIVNPSDTTVENAAAQAMSEIKGGALWQQLGFSPTDAFPSDVRSFKTAEGLTSKESKIYNEFMVRTYEILAEGRVERLQQLEANNSFTYLSDYTQTVSDVNDYVARTTNNITFFSRPPGTAGDLADALSWPVRKIPALQYSGLWPMFANATARSINLIYQGTPILNLAQPLVYKVTGTRGVLGSKIKGEKEFETKGVVQLDQKKMLQSAIAVNLIAAGVLGFLFSQYDTPDDEEEAIKDGKWTGIAPVTLTPAQREVFGNRLLEGYVYRNGKPVFKYMDTPFAGMFAGVAYIKNNSGLFGDAVLEQATRSQNLFVENQPEAMEALGGIVDNMLNMMYNSSSIRGLTEIITDVFGDRSAVAADEAGVGSKAMKALERVAANSIKNVIIPFHGASKEINNIVESFNGMNKKKATDFVEQMMMNELIWDGMIKSDMTDSWGRPVPERIKSMSPALGFNVFEVVGGKIKFTLDEEYTGDNYMALHIMHNYAPRTDNNLNFPVDITPDGSDIEPLELLSYSQKLKENKTDNISKIKVETQPLSEEIKKVSYNVSLTASESQKVNKQRGEIMKSVVDYGDNMDKLKVLNNQDYRNFMNSAYSLTKKIAVVNQHPDLVGAAYKISIQSAIDKLENTYNIAFPDELKQ